ncbi:phage head-tail connector protein [Planobispora rosea]|uniref:phage head-tail connector protein n=1 Tax=Planobispora rosea TaxID=35762 RepID=UPI00083A1D8E|nr:phage head-tail connector protein [Planobispora rosea]
MTYAYGSAVRLTQEVRSGGELVDPASITLTIRLPDGTTTSPTPVNDSVGVYHYDYTPTQAGRHIARWVTTGPVGAAEEPFDVAAQWETGIVSLAETKRHLNLTTSAEDDELTEMIRAVTEPIERHVGVVLRRTVVETHRGGYALVLQKTPVLSITSVEGVGSALDQDVADLLLDTVSGVVRRQDGGWIAGPVTTAYVAGGTSVSPSVRLASLMIIQHLWETQRGAATPRFGADEAVWDPRFGYAIPRRAIELLGEQVSGIA